MNVEVSEDSDIERPTSNEKAKINFSHFSGLSALGGFSIMGKRMEEAVKRYHEIQENNLQGGGAKHMERQHKRGKLSARERIEVLIDPGTFRELGSSVGTTSMRIDGKIPEAPCDGAVVGTAKVNDRMIMVHASDFTVLGGSVGAQHMLKFSRPIEMAAMWGIPYVILLDSSGGRLGYRDVPMAGIDWQFRIQSMYSGVIPQITVRGLYSCPLRFSDHQQELRQYVVGRSPADPGRHIGSHRQERWGRGLPYGVQWKL